MGLSVLDSVSVLGAIEGSGLLSPLFRSLFQGLGV